MKPLSLITVFFQILFFKKMDLIIEKTAKMSVMPVCTRLDAASESNPVINTR